MEKKSTEVTPLDVYDATLSIDKGLGENISTI